MTTRVPSKHQILCCPWRCSPDKAHNQSPCEKSSHIDGTELHSCVWIFLSVQTKLCSTLVKMPVLMEGNEGTFCITLNAGSGQVLTSASWISPIGLPNRTYSNEPNLCLQFISIIFRIFNAIEIIAFFRAPFPSASIPLYCHLLLQVLEQQIVLPFAVPNLGTANVNTTFSKKTREFWKNKEFLNIN